MEWLTSLFSRKRPEASAPAREAPVEVASDASATADADAPDPAFERMLAAASEARAAAYARLGTLDDDVLMPLVNPAFMGGPAWPAFRQAWRVVRRPGSTLVASDGLSDPFEDDQTPLGFRVEVCAEAFARRRGRHRMSTARVAALLLVLLGSPCGASEDGSAVYINYSPDMRYSRDGRDARIVLIPGQSLFAFGHDFGRLAPCADDASACMVFGDMALARPPADAEAGDRFRHGDFAFEVEGVETITVFGVRKEVIRIAVRRRGDASNHYLFSRTDGVVAIGFDNPDRSHVRKFLFLLDTESGVLQP